MRSRTLRAFPLHHGEGQVFSPLRHRVVLDPSPPFSKLKTPSRSLARFREKGQHSSPLRPRSRNLNRPAYFLLFQGGGRSFDGRSCPTKFKLVRRLQNGRPIPRPTYLSGVRYLGQPDTEGAPRTVHYCVRLVNENWLHAFRTLRVGWTLTKAICCTSHSHNNLVQPHSRACISTVSCILLSHSVPPKTPEPPRSTHTHPFGFTRCVKLVHPRHEFHFSAQRPVGQIVSCCPIYLLFLPPENHFRCMQNLRP